MRSAILNLIWKTFYINIVFLKRIFFFETLQTMSHGYCGYGRRFDQSYKEKFKSAWHNWETPAANYLKKDLNTVFIYQDS